MNAGKVTTGKVGQNFYGKHVDVSADGSIVVTGIANGQQPGVLNRYVEAVRYLADGRLDTSFGGSGKVGLAGDYYPSVAVAGQAINLNAGGTVQADGKILLVGTAPVALGIGSVITRLNPDGSLDTSFGNQGKVLTLLETGNYFASCILTQPDGKIVVAGFGRGPLDAAPESNDFVVARYNEDGSYDSTFYFGKPHGWDFTAPATTSSEDVSTGLAFQADGKVLVSGKSTVGGISTFSVMRLDAQGFPDPSFGNGGVVTTSFTAGVSDQAAATSVVALADGKILVAGNMFVSGQWGGALARYNSNGTLDTTFGNQGMVGSVYIAGKTANFDSMTLEADGHILVAGSFGGDVGITRYNADGSYSAHTLIPVGNAHSVTVQPDGKILIGGDVSQYIGGAAQSHFVLLRLNADLSLDTSFGNTADSASSYVMSAIEQNLLLTGSDAIEGHGNALDNILTGNIGNNLLDGGAGDDVLDGGAGADTLAGGDGSDVYVVDDAGDVVLEDAAGSGVDEVRAKVSHVLADNLENLTLLTGAINGTGNGLANILIGNTTTNRLEGGEGNDVLDGGIGADTLVGGNGSDSYYVDHAGDVVIEDGSDGAEIDTVYSKITYTLGATLENLSIVSGIVTGTGNALNNVMSSGSSADTLVGGLGNDTYIVNGSTDKVVETSTLASEIDTVLASASYVLSANVENLTLTGGADINGTGNTQANLIAGNSGNNTLDGAGGRDTLMGGQGADYYIVDSLDDVVLETDSLDGARDTVSASFDYTLGNEIESLVLTGSALRGMGNALNNTLVGNGLANVLDSGAGDDTLSGGVGADTMIGGSGNDSYTVDNAGDVIVELADSAQIDSVKSSISYVLGAVLENLTLTGVAALNGTGNASDNAITGNSGANILDGGAGADTLIGGLGNDSYVVDHAGDVVIETSALATELDQVTSSVSYVLGSNVENLYLSGSDDLNGTGNGLANIIYGNTGKNMLIGGVGNDTLAGLAGADTMDGGAGSDTYSVDDSGDIVIESASIGLDTVQSTISYTLSDNVEALTLNGTAAINGYGNQLNNTINGNGANNLLSGDAGNDNLLGAAGNDTLDGGAGNDALNGGIGNDVLGGGQGVDVLYGGTGADVFVIGNDDESIIVRDTIGDFKVAEGDKIDLSQFDANPLLAGRQALSFVTNFSADATGQVKFTAAQNFLIISTDADATAEYVITLTGVTTLTAASLIL